MLETFFSKINKSYIAASKRKDIEDIHEYLEDFDEETVFFNKLILLGQDSIWYKFIILTGLFNMMYSIMAAIVTIYDRNYVLQTPDTFYIIDICWGVDILVRLLSNKKKVIRSSTLPVPNNYRDIVIQIVAVFPIELFAYNNNAIYNFLMLNRQLKILHVLAMFYFLDSKIECVTSTKVVQLVYLLLWIIGISALTFIFIKCYPETSVCKSDNMYNHIIVMIRISAGLVTSQGFGLLSHEHNAAKFVLVCTSYFTFIAVTTLFTALLTFGLAEYANHKGSFRYRFNAIILYSTQNGMTDDFLDIVHKYFDKMWSQCGGYEGYMAECNQPYGGNVFKHVLPRAMLIEIQTDVFWGAFSHSILFQDLDIPFLKELAVVMKQVVYISGQYVFHQNELKEKMIYIFSGMIQLISDEDGETPLISFADGTCLSETALLLPYKSKYKVRCFNTCVIQVLERRAFLKVSKKYPHVFKKLIKIVQLRYNDSKYMHNTKHVVNKKCNDLIVGSLSTMWINFTLHKLMGAKGMDSARNHAVQNIYLQNSVNHKTFEFYLFSARYLSMYAITERTTANNDTLFIKSTFPYIFKPKTGLILFWDLLISTVALVNGICLPIFCFVIRGRYKSFYSWVYTITCFWWMDNIVKLRTAIDLKHRTITNPWEMLVFRFFDLTFLVDLVSSVPIEIFSPMLVERSNEKLIFINRVLKVSRIFRLLGSWERRYNSNPVIVRIIYISIVMGLSINFLSCIYYYIGCINDCDLKWIEFYSLQIFSGVALWVEGYSIEMKFNMVNIVLFTLVSIIFAIFYSLLFSAHAFSNSHILKVKEQTMKFVNVMTIIEKRLLNRILSYVKTEEMTLNGLNIYRNNYIFKTLPKPLLGHLYEKLYINWIDKLPMFAGIPLHIIIDILQSATTARQIATSVPLYLVGDLLKEILILSQGQIELICGSDFGTKIIKEKKAVNDIEIFLDIPCFSSATTVTNCEILYINFAKMKKVLLKYENCLSIKPFPSVRDIRTKILNIPTYQTRRDFFYYHYKIKSICEHKKNRYFKSTYKNEGCSILRCMLLSTTIYPNGTCFLTLEWIRAICSVASALLFPTTGLILYKVSHPIKLTLIVLDVLAFLDIYIRLHVCFYDKRGILITHPLYTARNYVHNSLWIDLLAAFPLQAIIQTNKLIALNINKVLQIYRYFGLLNWIQMDREKPITHAIRLMYLPIFVIFINIGASFVVTLNCDIEFEDGKEKYIDCSKYSMLILNRMQWDVSSIKLHLYAFYILITTVTKTAVQGFEIANFDNMYILAVFSVIALFWNVIISAKIFGFCTMEYMNIIKNDLNRTHLLRFMNMHNVPKTFLTYVEDFLHRASYMQRFDVHNAMKRFPKTMQRECLFERYGRILVSMCLTDSSDFSPFIRNCLLHSRYLIFEKNGYVLTINDVVGETMFIFSGIVELVQSDGTVLTLLKPGSIIGNLCEIKYNRMRVTIIATSTVEIIALDASKFQKILNYFPSTKKQFKMLRCTHGTHIPGYSAFTYKQVNRKKELIFSSFRRTHGLYVFSILSHIFGCFLSILIYLYQVSVSEFLFTIQICNIITDILYTTLFVLYIMMEIEENHRGNANISNLVFTFFNNRNNYTSLIAAIPFEFILYGLTLNERRYYYYFVFLRSHVLLRIFFIYNTIAKNDYCYRTRIFTSQLVLIVMTLMLIIFGGTAVLMGFSEIDNGNMNKFIDREQLLNENTLGRLNEFIRWFFVVACAFTKTSQIAYYPIDWLYVILFSAMMIFMEMTLSDVRANIISMVQVYGHHKSEYRKKLNHLHCYLKTYETSQSLVDRVSYYTSMIWNNLSGYKYPLMLNMIPGYLKEAILYSAIGSTVECHPAFGKCHFDLKRQIVSKMKFEYYYYGDYIQYKGIADNTMYWVLTGEIVCLSENSTFRDDIIKVLKAGDAFGIPQGIFNNMPHNVSYRATSHTCVVYLEKSDWDYLMIFFPGSRNIIYQEAEKCQLEEQNYDLAAKSSSTSTIFDPIKEDYNKMHCL